MVKKAYELSPDKDYILLTDSQDINEVVRYIGWKDEKPTGVIVKLANGDYAEVWFTWSSRPYSIYADYELVYQSGGYGQYEIKPSVLLLCTVEKKGKKVKLDCEEIGSDNGLSGIVIDEEVARTSPCIRIDGTNLVFSKGIIGALNKEQKEKYCPTIIEKTPETSDVLCVHLKDFERLVKTVREKIQKMEERR